MTDPIPDGWRSALAAVLAHPEARRLGGWLRAEEEAGKILYPPRGARLRALELTPLDAVRGGNSRPGPVPRAGTGAWS